MANQESSLLSKLRRLESTLWQVGLGSLIFTAPAGAVVGYSEGIRGILIGLAFAFAISGVILLAALLTMWVETRVESREKDRHA